MSERGSIRSESDRAVTELKRGVLRIAPGLRPMWIRLKSAIFRARFRTNAKRFDEIFQANHWRNPESVSGFGSTQSATVDVRDALTSIIERHGVNSILDVPCGDFNWMRGLPFGGTYRGGDIVPDLVRRTSEQFADERRSFFVIDIASDVLPPSDLMICRDCLNHLSLADGNRALQNIRDSGCGIMAITHYPEVTVNRDQPSGFEYRPLNLRLAPFHLPEPTEIWAESEPPGKTLAVWTLEPRELR